MSASCQRRGRAAASARLCAWSTSPGSTPAPATTAPPRWATSAAPARPTRGWRPTPTPTRPTPPSAWPSRAATCRPDVRAVLTRVQNDLFDIGADLSTPLQRTYEYPPLRVKEEWVTELETDCDHYLERLEKLRSFILPGGTPGRRAPARGPDRRAPGRALGVGGRRGLRHRARRRPRARWGQPGHRDLPQPALGPAVRAGPLRQPARRRRALEARRRPRADPQEPRPPPRLRATCPRFWRRTATRTALRSHEVGNEWRDAGVRRR